MYFERPHLLIKVACLAQTAPVKHCLKGLRHMTVTVTETVFQGRSLPAYCSVPGWACDQVPSSIGHLRGLICSQGLPYCFLQGNTMYWPPLDQEKLGHRTIRAS